jgi:hypothetical protein
MASKTLESILLREQWSCQPIRSPGPFAVAPGDPLHSLLLSICGTPHPSGPIPIHTVAKWDDTHGKPKCPAVPTYPGLPDNKLQKMINQLRTSSAEPSWPASRRSKFGLEEVHVALAFR